MHRCPKSHFKTSELAEKLLTFSARGNSRGFPTGVEKLQETYRAFWSDVILAAHLVISVLNLSANHRQRTR